MSFEIDHAWAARVSHVKGRESRVHVRNNSFSVDDQASLRDRDDHPSAIEYVLGAIGADLMAGFVTQATRAGLAVEAAEMSLQARLDNVLAYLAVVGESGHAGLASISGTLYASVDGEEDVVRALWRTSLERSPLYQTFSRCTHIEIELRLT